MVLRREQNRERIFQLFVYNESLSFSNIFKKTKIPSNLLAYFLSRMIIEGVLEKKGGKYMLTERAEKLIPFFVKDSENISPLVVVLAACIKDGKVLLVKRIKRPYKGLWALPSGRLMIKESIGEGAVRVLKEKGFIDSRFNKIKSVVFERLVEGGKSKHGFVFFLSELVPIGKEYKETDFAKFFDISSLKKKSVIASDYWMIKNKLKEGIFADVTEEIMQSSGKSTKMHLLAQ